MHDDRVAKSAPSIDSLRDHPRRSLGLRAGAPRGARAAPAHDRHRRIEARPARTGKRLPHRCHDRESLRRHRLSAGLPGLPLGPAADGDAAMAERTLRPVRRRQARLRRLPDVSGQARPPDRQRHDALHHGVSKPQGGWPAGVRGSRRPHGRWLHRFLAAADHRFRTDRPRQGRGGQVSDPRPRRSRDEAGGLFRLPVTDRERLVGPPRARSRSGPSQAAHRRLADLSLQPARPPRPDPSRIAGGAPVERRTAARPRVLGGSREDHRGGTGPRARPDDDGNAPAAGHREGQAVHADRAAEADPRRRRPDRRGDGPGDRLPQAVRRGESLAGQELGDLPVSRRDQPRSPAPHAVGRAHELVFTRRSACRSG